MSPTVTIIIVFIIMFHEVMIFFMIVMMTTNMMMMFRMVKMFEYGDDAQHDSPQDIIHKVDG